ncbi:MAG: flagellar biosynthesis protein FlgD, partial [Rhodospirillales bacterium]|nr:flagellar biosynthesis protein FlgD [Rhodospirillales bacterium]
MSGTVTTTSTASSSGGTQNALASLSSNFQTFLGMLMTQLKNQDPTSPLDTNQFTSELVQFSSVEQQINTNTSLGQLIQLTQNGQMMQSASIVGHKVDVASSTLPLQNGSGTVQFTAASAGPVSITISNAQGSVVGSATVNATQGVNTWNWNGTDSNG